MTVGWSRRNHEGTRDVPQLIRHRIGAILLEEVRQQGLGMRDVFEGRQEPLSWYFRGLAYDQSELDILESGAVDELHAPSALVEFVLDEMALACWNLGVEGVASYLEVDDPEGAGGSLPGNLSFPPDLMLGYLNVDVAPPARWLERREADADANERLAKRLAELAREIGGEADAVEVHIEGMMEADTGWVERPSTVRPAGVSMYLSFDVPLAGADERELSHVFGRGARAAAGALERLRSVFRDV